MLIFIILTIPALSGCGREEAEPDNIPIDIADIAVDYILDYENGTTAIGELPIGTRIADPTWTWEYRPGYSYSNECPSILEPYLFFCIVKYDRIIIEVAGRKGL